MEKLVAFLKFITENHLEAAARENIATARAMNLPLMKFFEHLPEDQLLAQSMQGIRDFYTSLADGSYLQRQAESMRLWEEDKLPGIPKDSIKPSDLVLIYAVQKKGYFKFLPAYTTDSQLVIDIVQELDKIYLEGQEMAVNLLFRMQKEAEARAVASSERFQLLVESAKDYAIFMIDPQGYIVSWNKGAEAIKGYTADEVIGKHFSIFYTEEELAREEAQYNLEQALLHGRYETEGWRKRKDGSLFWGDVIFTALYDEKGKLRGFSKVTRDTTERKNAEEHIIKLNDTLREKIAELEMVNNELEAFSYSVSHDLRAPLRAIHSYTQILSEEYINNLDDDAKRKMSRVMFNAKKMGRLIDDLLAFSKVGKKELLKDSVDMTAVARTALKEAEGETPSASQTVLIRPLPAAYADYSLVKQVYCNLISNAIKYSQHSPKPEIELGATEEEGDTVYYIKDNGVGFDMRHYDKLFGVFQRLHGADEFEGTGVGLALVKRIVAKHGGRIWARAEPGKGATFSFTLNTHQTKPKNAI